jgi:hypothetical protein
VDHNPCAMSLLDALVYANLEVNGVCIWYHVRYHENERLESAKC